MLRKLFVVVTMMTAIVARPSAAQSRVGKDSATRITRFGRDLIYGTAEGLAYAGVDQVSNSPAEWGRGWPGYEKRAASNLGEFLIQESVTEGLAAAMDRPLDYTRCVCRGTTQRIGWAIKGAFTDQMADGRHPIAIPRIVGAFAGSFAQSTWRPDARSGRTRVALVNGATSLVIGAGINIYHEFKHDVERALH